MVGGLLLFVSFGVGTSGMLPLSEVYRTEYLCRGTDFAFYVIASVVSFLCEKCGVGGETVHQFLKLAVAGDLESAVGCFQFLGFLETFIIGAKEDRNVPYSGFQHIVDAYPKSSTYIRRFTIVVDA